MKAALTSAELVSVSCVPTRTSAQTHRCYWKQQQRNANDATSRRKDFKRHVFFLTS